ncbi:Beta-glucanase precursor [Poriferisphaera corsica]|uniref:Beta-glucanase n=1 Tax=Poriferisphaera corsica TaxID=2528020 RepID=A0A517YWQ1_9BACT|nr:glycoside hydrolase family 16 protein [Poriferisphaera corsica]QDU34640.1 Beta-glucanase precursor [Poriferisphaera corsica]
MQLRLFAIFSTLILLVSTATAADQTWQLDWSDEFDYQGLPNPRNWNYEEGFVRNHETQYYTQARKKNARVEDGKLIIQVHQEEHRNPKYSPNAKPSDWRRSRKLITHTSASLTTRGKHEIHYGRIEVRAKLPTGNGMWPAIWTKGISQYKDKQPWPKCGEIDILEYAGKEPGIAHTTIHYFDKKNKQHKSGPKFSLNAENLEHGFHTYALEWSPQSMQFFFDGKPYHTIKLDDIETGQDNPFRKPHFLLINLAIGGNWGGPVDNSNLPQQFIIDYVRVYQRKPSPLK